MSEPIRLSREQARRVTGGIGAVPCCPHCSSSDISLVSTVGREHHGNGAQPRRFWKCGNCGREFDQPNIGFPEAI